jgi:hypothetical protein
VVCVVKGIVCTIRVPVLQMRVHPRLQTLQVAELCGASMCVKGIVCSICVPVLKIRVYPQTVRLRTLHVCGTNR